MTVHSENVPALILIIFIAKALAPEAPLDFIDMGEPEKAWLNIGIGAVIGIFIAISLLAGTIAEPAAMVFTVASPISFFFIVLVAPMVETLFFQGALLPTLAMYLSKPVALMLSSVVFALYHITTWGATGLIGLVTPFLFALLLGLLTLKFESVAPALFAHMAANTVITVATMSTALIFLEVLP